MGVQISARLVKTGPEQLRPLLWAGPFIAPLRMSGQELAGIAATEPHPVPAQLTRGALGTTEQLPPRNALTPMSMAGGTLEPCARQRRSLEPRGALVGCRTCPPPITRCGPPVLGTGAAADPSLLLQVPSF